MKKVTLFFVYITFTSLQALSDQTITGPKYNFVCADFAKGEVCIVNNKGEITQSFRAQNPNDVWSLPNGDVLFAYRRGVKLYGNEGTLKFEWKSNDKRDEIHTCQPLSDKNIPITEWLACMDFVSFII